MIQSSQHPVPPNQPWFVRAGLPFVVFVLGVGGLMLLLFLKPEKPPIKPKNAVPVADVFDSVSYPGKIAIESSGIVMPFREYTISAQVAGTIKTKDPACEAGRFVKYPKTLIEIDPLEFELEVQRLQQELEQSKIQLTQQKLEQENLKKQISRSEEELNIVRDTLQQYLQTGNKGIYSQKDIDTARLQELSSRDKLEGQREQLVIMAEQAKQLQKATELAETRLEIAKLDLKRCTIDVPCDGVVVEERVEVNSFVSPGTVLLTFEDTSRVEIECDLLIDELVEILANAGEPLGPYELPGNRTVVTFKTSDRKYQWVGRLTRQNGVGLDDRTRTVPCIIEVDQVDRKAANGLQALVRGMYVSVQIEIAPVSPVVIVPSIAQQTPGQIWIVKNDKLVPVEIELVEPKDPDALAALSQQPLVLAKSIPGVFEPGAQIVTSPLPYAVEGQTVDPKPYQLGEDPNQNPSLDIDEPTADETQGSPESSAATNNSADKPSPAQQSSAALAPTGMAMESQS